MQSSQHLSSHDSPEAITQAEASTYKYSIPDRSAPYAIHDTSKEVALPSYAPNSTVRGQDWTRWPLLLLYAVLLAVIAGVMGGFIGEAISKQTQKQVFSDTNSSKPTNTSSNDTSARILPIPSTGCPSDISEQKYMPSVSKNWKVDYTTVCATRWTDPQLTALSTATASDCIEACQSYNAADPPNSEACLGASFVPRWWNQTLAMERKNEPFNCFLMRNNTILNRNEMDFEIVALCLKDACKGLIGG